jgi:hypothetical protein
MLALLLTLAASGGVDRFDSWIVERLGATRTVAMTTVPSGGSFGQICTPDEGCAWSLVISGSCAPGDTHPALGASSAAAMTLELACEERFGGGMARFSFVHPERVDALMKGATRLGIAVPLRDDDIRVLHFELDGMKAALERARARNDKRR